MEDDSSSSQSSAKQEQSPIDEESREFLNMEEFYLKNIFLT